MINRSKHAAWTRRFARIAAACVIACGARVAAAQIAGESVNMVTGRTWPRGDPFLQRQNEPSIAVSSANPQHLLAGANDYRSVDLPDPLDHKVPVMADAWLGVFKSLDGGQTWKSHLLPGYLQDHATCDAGRSPACGLQAAADPVMRAGTDGMFYFAGLVFNRDKTFSKIVVSRFLDLNDRENGDATAGEDPIRFVDTVEVARGGPIDGEPGFYWFVDKPWIAVDVPRGGAETCTIDVPASGAQPAARRTFAGGTIYAAWSRIKVDARNPDDVKEISSDIVLKRSTNCGATWSSTEVQLNDATSAQSQGAILGIDPTTGKVYVAWRRIGNGTQGDAIFIVRSFSRGFKFTKPRVVAAIPPGAAFDQGMTTTMFRSRALPTFAVSVGPDGANRHLHLAWAQRNAAGFSRIVMTTANVSPPPSSGQEADETSTTADHWSAPVAVDDVEDAVPLADGDGVQAIPFTKGHQFMPQLAASQGRLVLVYYDSRFDHVRSILKPHAGADGRFTPDPFGQFYDERKAPMFTRDGRFSPRWDPSAAVFNRWLDDVGDRDALLAGADPVTSGKAIRSTRHTVEVRVAMAVPGPAPSFT